MDNLPAIRSRKERQDTRTGSVMVTLCGPASVQFPRRETTEGEGQ
mgnify:CR=1 FL=1